MFLSYLSLVNFRSYKELELELRPGVTTFVGGNGAGKTNIVESIGFLAYLASHRTSSDNPLIKIDSDGGYIRAKVLKDNREELLEVEINQGRANRARINQQPLKSTREMLGHLRAVLFTPEDLALVKGDPSERRIFLDRLLISRSPRYAGVVADYEKALKQRNSLLKNRPNERDLLPWNEHVAKFGAVLISARIGLIAELMPLAIRAYSEIAAGEAITATYKCAQELQGLTSASLEQEIMTLFPQLYRAELERGVTLVGPHRDDLLLTLGRSPVKGFASQGELWSYALALRIASFNLLQSDGDEPILILDDVFAVLDNHRRAALIKVIAEAEQVLITAAVAEDLPKVISDRRFLVQDGRVNE